MCLYIKYTRLKLSFSKELIWDFFQWEEKNTLELEFCLQVFFAVRMLLCDHLVGGI